MQLFLTSSQSLAGLSTLLPQDLTLINLSSQRSFVRCQIFQRAQTRIFECSTPKLEPDFQKNRVLFQFLKEGANFSKFPTALAAVSAAQIA